MLSTSGAQFNLVLISLIYVGALAVQDAVVDTTITIPLNATLQYDNREMFAEYIKLNGSATVKVNFTDISTNIVFIVFQVHSHLINITLNKNMQANLTEIGTNLGLVSILKVSKNDVKPDTFYITNPNENITVRAFISVHGYGLGDPIPGGCNLEFPIKIAPYLKVTTDTASITVDAAFPATDPECLVFNESYITFHMMYLPEMNFYADDYFSGIRNMMTLENIDKYGRPVPSTAGITRRVLSAYPGTGVVFVAVARTENNYSIYVPNYSYGCEKTDENGCVFTDDMLSQILCATLLFIGLFVSFLGHRFFKTEMFLAGFFSGFIISYILVTLMDTSIDTTALVAASTLSGVFFGAIWLLFWWLYGIPVIAVLLPSLNLGFLIASIFYYTLPAGVFYLEEDFNFWSLFIMLMCLSALAMVSVTYAANILCCAVLGAFATTYSFDYFMGSNLKYILINTVRRAVVPKFNRVVLAPPLLWREMMATCLWVLVAALGWSFQHWYNRGRPPFPPPPRSTREAAPDSTSYGAITEPRREETARLAGVQPAWTGPRVSGTYNERSHLLGGT